MQNGFTFLPDYPADVLAVAGHGTIDADAYEEVLRPELEARLRHHAHIRLLYLLGDDFEGFTAGAAVSDARLGLSHLHDFSRIALVTDVGWITHAMRLFAPLIPGQVRCFETAAFDTAHRWITEDDPMLEAKADPPVEDSFPV